MHGRIGEYVSITDEFDRTIQLGDMGFRDDYLKIRGLLNPAHHKFIPGNHDDYDTLPPHALGDYGHIPWVHNGFYMRGGRSIDRHLRIEGVSWWRQEELTYSFMQLAIDWYKAQRPDIVMTHECPAQVLPFIGRKDLPNMSASMTARALANMLDEHQPTLWLFGHHHKKWEGDIRGTHFRCVDILDTFELIGHE